METNSSAPKMKLFDVGLAYWLLAFKNTEEIMKLTWSEEPQSRYLLLKTESLLNTVLVIVSGSSRDETRGCLLSCKII